MKDDVELQASAAGVGFTAGVAWLHGYVTRHGHPPSGERLTKAADEYVKKFEQSVLGVLLARLTGVTLSDKDLASLSPTPTEEDYYE